LDNGLYSKGWTDKHEYWQTVTPVVTFKGDSIYEIKLIPVNLLFGKPKGVRGRPVLANRQTGRAIISNITTLSKPNNVQIRYKEEENVGIVQIEK